MPLDSESATPCIHIYQPVLAEAIIIRRHCNDCKKRSPFISFFYEWHGWHQTCLRCGRQVDDGEQLAAPFTRGWRKRNIEEAKRLYRQHKPAKETTNE